MVRIQKQISLQDTEQSERLKAIAGGWNRSVSGLLQAIANGHLCIDRPLSISLQQAIVKAIVLLQEQQATELAQLLATFVQTRPEVSEPIRAEVKRLMQEQSRWMKQAKSLIAKSQPFQLHYHDHTYTVLYAEFFTGDKRTYLHGWCQEANDAPDHPDLAHNRFFRLDQTAQATPIDAAWRWQGLDTLEVKLAMRFRYAPKPEDVAVEQILVGGEARTQVTKRVSSLFWLMQDIQRYGDRAIVLAPDLVRQKVVEGLRSQLSLYDCCV